MLGVLVTSRATGRAPRRRRGHRPRARDDVEIDRGTGDNRPRGAGRSHVTVLGRRCGPSDGRRRRPDRRHRREHRPHRADGALPGHRDRPARLRRRHRPAPGCCLGGRAAGRRRRRPAGQPAAPRNAADRHGRRLDAHPGRGDRDARRARGVPRRGRRGHRGGDARRARLRGVAA